MERTAVRDLGTSVMLVGPPAACDRIAKAFERVRAVRVIRVGHVAAACERLAVAMPQVAIVVGNVHASEREALSDRAGAVGALVVYVDPQLDGEALDDLVNRAANAAVDRKLRRDDSGPAGKSVLPADDDDD